MSIIIYIAVVFMTKYMNETDKAGILTTHLNVTAW